MGQDRARVGVVDGDRLALQVGRVDQAALASIASFDGDVLVSIVFTIRSDTGSMIEILPVSKLPRCGRSGVDLAREFDGVAIFLDYAVGAQVDDSDKVVLLRVVIGAADVETACARRRCRGRTPLRLGISPTRRPPDDTIATLLVLLRPT